MSYYSLSRIGDLPDILQLIQTDPDRVAMIDRFLAESADANLLGVLGNLKTDILAAEASGQPSESVSLMRISDALQGIEDQAQVTVKVSSDSSGTTCTVETEGTALEYP